MKADQSGARRSPPLRSILDTTATLFVIAVCATMLWFMLSGRGSIGQSGRQDVPARRPEPPLPSEPLSLDGATTLGNRTAKVAVIAFSEFQCPYCGVFARDTWPTLERSFVQSGKVLFAFRHLPLESIHPFAAQAAQAAECAGRQGKFWQMHDLLFKDQKRLDVPSLREHAKALGLAPSDFARCLDGEMTAKVQRDASTAKALGVSATPTFFIGSLQADGRVKVVQRLAGAQPLAQFTAALDKLLGSMPTSSK